jgi:hypothetical protein
MRKLAGEIDVYRIRGGDYRVLCGVGDAVRIVGSVTAVRCTRSAERTEQSPLRLARFVE